MATNTARIDQLEKSINTLLANERALDVRLQMLNATDSRTEAATTALREELDRLRQKSAEAEQRIAVLETMVKELKTSAEKWGQRWWQVAAALLIAILGGVAGYLLKR